MAGIVAGTPPSVADFLAAPNAGSLASSRDFLRQSIDRAAQFLPLQGPIRSFVAMNTLQAFEDLPFDEGVRAGAELFHCEPYLPEERFRALFESGRIRVEDLVEVLRQELGAGGDEKVLHFGSRFDIRLAMLRFPLQQARRRELQWYMAETDALRTFRTETPFAVRQRVIQETRRWVQQAASSEMPSANVRPEHAIPDVVSQLLGQHDDAAMDRWQDSDWEAFTLELLWRVCRQGIHGVPDPRSQPPQPLRHRDALLLATGHDSDLLVHEILVRFCAAYLDQGFAVWTLPERDQSFSRAFATFAAHASVRTERWRAGLASRMAAFRDADFDPLTSIENSLLQLGVAQREWPEFLAATLVALRGWAGMIRQMSLRSDLIPRPIPAGSLDQFLATRLVLDSAAGEFLAREHLQFSGPLSELKRACAARHRKPVRDRIDQRAYVLFQLAQQNGWLPKDLQGLPPSEWGVLIQEVEAFSHLERRKLFQRAFERNYQVRMLDAISFRAKQTSRPDIAPRFQVVCCIDDREESFRRHLEEVSPATRTFGVAGFFNVPMYYRGVAQAHFRPLCPIVMLPSHWITEEVLEEDHEIHAKQTRARQLFGLTLHQLQQRSQTFWGGALIAAGFGALATFPLVARVLFPRLAAKLRNSAGLWVLPHNTRLKLRRTAAEPSRSADGVGFTVEEMANFGQRMLTDIGLTSGFAPLVVLTGHGSSSLNNPHKSVYDCGACGGGEGGPNARAAADILNQPDVRSKLSERGIHIPDAVFFVGAYHDTCNDQVTLYPPDHLTPDQQSLLHEFQAILSEARRRNAHERSRRFMSADPRGTFADGQRHVEARSEDLAQPRPEYGHSTVAGCFVGRRERIQGLFLDRRSFLVSYDPTRDDEEVTILSRIMTPVVPVCVGIAMQYFFSNLDSVGWGSDSKLPHNVTSMLGVMDGMASDLRTGLPRQGVDIHEPQRLLFVLEISLKQVPKLFQRVPYLEQLARNGWLQLTLLDPESAQLMVYHAGEFCPYVPESQIVPRAASSWEWYRGARDHLPFAIID